MNLFMGKMVTCNDGNNLYLRDCVDEYVSSPFDWNITAPRSYANPNYGFDSFASALSILFQIMSLEGENGFSVSFDSR